MKPPFTYYGGKSVLAPRIADLLPQHEHYVEPFAGSLSVLLAKPISPLETVNDLDGDLVTFWRVLREKPGELTKAARLTPHSRAEFEASRDLSALDDVEVARRVWVRLTQSRSQSMKPTGWKYAMTPGDSMQQRLGTFADRIPECAARISNVSLECRDALAVIADYGRHSTACLYVDPPYLGTTRATNYRHELTRDDEHRALADALAACSASVVLSGYDSPLYGELFAGWHRTELKAPTALSGDTGRVEILWSNRPLGEDTLFGGVA